MAERFGGKYSPGGAQAPQVPGTERAVDGQTPARPFDGQTPARAGARVNLLFAAAVPFAITAFFQQPTGLALDLGAFAALILGAWLTRDGVLAHQAYDARKVSRRPAIPRKIFGSALAAAGLFLGGYVPGGGLTNPLIFAVAGGALHLFSFGSDPLKDKGMAGVDIFQTDRVARAVQEGEAYLAAMKDAMLRAGDRSLDKRVEVFAATARKMFRTVENDPRDLTAARKYLTIYLMGARDATVKFADIYARNRDPQARSAYEALLADLETNFTGRIQALLADDRTDLTIEIDVLRERLQREGVKPGTQEKDKP